MILQGTTLLNRFWPLTLLLAGALMTFGLPPFAGLPVFFVSLPICWHFLKRVKTKRSAFAVGWWFGFGFYVSGLYWIGNAVLVDAERFGWLYPFALALIPALCAVFTGCVALAAYSLPVQWSSGFAPLRMVWFAMLWMVAEIVRGKIFLFPWHLMGYGWMATDALMQAASLVGVYGLGAALVWGALLPAHRWWWVFVPVMLLATVQWWGTRRLETPVALTDTKIRIVQANIAQRPFNTPQDRVKDFQQHLKMSEGSDADIIVWPESAASFFLHEEPIARQEMADILKPGQYIATGTMRIQREKPNLKIWNSIGVVDSTGDIVSNYDKVRLVPFGEFVPFGKFVPFLEKITDGAVDFSAGRGTQTVALNVRVPPFSPLVCYEIAFSGMVVDKKNRPGWLLNVTNDAWFGESIGPYQHLAMAQMRAIEEGLPVVRAANTGVSALIDPYGRIVQVLPLNHSDILDGRLPKALALK